MLALQKMNQKWLVVVVACLAVAGEVSPVSALVAPEIIVHCDTLPQNETWRRAPHLLLGSKPFRPRPRVRGRAKVTRIFLP